MRAPNPLQIGRTAWSLAAASRDDNLELLQLLSHIPGIDTGVIDEVRPCIRK